MTAKAMSNPICPECKQELNQVRVHSYYSELAKLEEGKAVSYGDEQKGDFIDACCDNCGEDVSELVELPYLDSEERSDPS